MEKRIPIILDTDIGDDVDDALALGLICRSPELDLRAITTVFNNTFARVRQAQTILKIVGHKDIPVAAGCGSSLTTPLKLWNRNPGIVGGKTFQYPEYHYVMRTKLNQESACLPESELAGPDSRHAVDLLIETYMKSEEKITLVTIGAMTNVAMALVKEPLLKTKIPKIVAMAGAFDRLSAEWNIACDPWAAHIVLSSGIPVRLIGLDVTTKCQFDKDDMARLDASKDPLARNLSEAVRGWGTEQGPSMHFLPMLHDPLAVMTIFKPDICTMQVGTATVELVSQKAFGFTYFDRQENGPHEVCFTVKSREALDLWFERILGS